jgi:hypothetical protein
VPGATATALHRVLLVLLALKETSWIWFLQWALKDACIAAAVEPGLMSLLLASVGSTVAPTCCCSRCDEKIHASASVMVAFARQDLQSVILQSGFGSSSERTMTPLVTFCHCGSNAACFDPLRERGVQQSFQRQPCYCYCAYYVLIPCVAFVSTVHRDTDLLLDLQRMLGVLLQGALFLLAMAASARAMLLGKTSSFWAGYCDQLRKRPILTKAATGWYANC